MNGQFLTAEEQFDRRAAEVGWFELGELERLACEVIDQLKDERVLLEERCFEAEDELSYYQNRVDSLERDNEMLHELSAEADETTQDDEVEFLKGLVTDLENELAAIDAEAVA